MQSRVGTFRLWTPYSSSWTPRLHPQCWWQWVLYPCHSCPWYPATIRGTAHSRKWHCRLNTHGPTVPGRVPIVSLPLKTVDIGKTDRNFTTPNSLIKIKVKAGVVLKWPSFPTGKAERGVPPYHLHDEPGALPGLVPPHTSPWSQVDSRTQKELRSSYKAQEI